jgi:hypothetical protein
VTTAPVTHEPLRDRYAWLGLRHAYAAVAISVIWLSVLFTAVYGPEIVNTTATTTSTVPAAVVVSFFAFLATIPVARWGFRE